MARQVAEWQHLPHHAVGRERRGPVGRAPSGGPVKFSIGKQGIWMFGEWGRISLDWGRSRGNSADWYRWAKVVIDIVWWRFLDLTFTTHPRPMRWERED